MQLRSPRTIGGIHIHYCYRTICHAPRVAIGCIHTHYCYRTIYYARQYAYKRAHKKFVRADTKYEVIAMKIKEKIKAVLGKRRDAAQKRRARTDSELGAEEVIEKEVFPDKPAKKRAAPATKRACAKRCTPSDCTCKRNAAQKPASKRTRPTNPGYEMIDPSDDTCDANKS